LAAVSALAARAPRTVLDFYFLLPDDYFDAPRKDLLDPNRGAIVDNEHGYLHVVGDGSQFSIWLALYKKADAGRIVVLFQEDEEGGCNSLKAYAYSGGHLVDMTKSVLPSEPCGEEKFYELPRTRTAIGVRATDNNGGRHLYDLIWSGSRFRVRRR